MLAGRQFKLEKSTLALAIVDGRRNALTIPAETIITVVAGLTPGEWLIDVLWEGKTLEMFEVDVNVRGTEVENRNAGA